MSVDQTVDDLVQKLSEHRSQLEQVEQLLVAKPGDSMLTKLHEDLKKVVELTEDLMKTQEERRAKEVKVGDRCEAVWTDGKWYTARVDSVDEANNKYGVTYLVYGNTGEVRIENMRPYKHAKKSQVRVGAEVRAFWQADGLFYPATVESITSNGHYRVNFKGYKYKAELSLSEILPIHQENDDELPEKAVIPDHLKIKPTDNVKQKELKKKKIKALKSRHRKRKIEVETEKKKNSWQSFLTGGKKKLRALKNRKKSIFASPDSVDGRVGVVGSGKRMTTFDDRKRHSFQEDSSVAGVKLPQFN